MQANHYTIRYKYFIENHPAGMASELQLLTRTDLMCVRISACTFVIKAG